MANSMPLYVITIVALLGLAIGCKHDASKCRDIGNDCCENSGMRCDSGYRVEKQGGKDCFPGVKRYKCCAPGAEGGNAGGECDQIDNSKCQTVGRHDGYCTAAIAWGARESPGCDPGYRVENLGERTVLGVGAQGYNCRNEEACDGPIVVIILIVVGVVVGVCAIVALVCCLHQQNQAKVAAMNNMGAKQQIVQPAVVVGQAAPVVGVAVQPQPAAAVAVQPQMMNVQVPEGMTEGQELQVQGPNGMFTFKLPAGAVSGQTIQVQVPPVAATPVAATIVVATPVAATPVAATPVAATNEDV